jgi:hypothetical protein
MQQQAAQLLPRVPMFIVGSLLALTLAIPNSVLNGQTVSYEADLLPESDTSPWTRVGTSDASRWLDSGRFFQLVTLGSWAPGPFGQFDGYKRDIGEFTGAQSFFVTWRFTTNCPSADIEETTAGVVLATSMSHDFFHFTVTNDEVRFLRDNPLALEFYVDVQPGVFHTYYLTLKSDLSYSWYIDGVLVNAAQFPSPFPTSDARIQWWARFYNDEQTAQWDYVRYGVIPADRSGDFDSNSVVDTNDLYFFVDCLLGPDYDANGPGCRWADMNGDGKVDGADVQLFCRAMTST